MAIGVSSSYDALVDLFECVGNFLGRLSIYTNMPLADGMMDILVRIMAEVLSVLALATKQIKQGRFSKLIPLNFFAFVSRPFREVRRGVAEAWRRYRGRPPEVGPPHPR